MSNAFSGFAAGITKLQGDVTAEGTSTVTATLTNTAVTPGNYTNANIEVDSKGRIISAANGSSGGGTWGGITGTLSNQTDLQAALNAKANISGQVFTGAISATNLGGTNTGDQTSVTGNAGTATALQTARTINGVSFDGTANITVPAAAGTLTGTTLASGIVSSSLTSVGTIATGVWQGAAITDTYIASAATWNAKQNALTLTTTGTSGAATLVGATLNIPQYGGATIPSTTNLLAGNGSGGVSDSTIVPSNVLLDTALRAGATSTANRIAAISKSAGVTPGPYYSGEWYDAALGVTATVTLALTANRIYLAPVPVFTQDVTISNIGLYYTIGAAGAACQYVIYECDNTGQPTGSPVYQSASVNPTASNTLYSIAASFTFAAGKQYAWGMIVDTAGLTCRAVAGGNCRNLRKGSATLGTYVSSWVKAVTPFTAPDGSTLVSADLFGLPPCIQIQVA